MTAFVDRAAYAVRAIEMSQRVAIIMAISSILMLLVLFSGAERANALSRQIEGSGRLAPEGPTCIERLRNRNDSALSALVVKNRDQSRCF